MFDLSSIALPSESASLQRGDCTLLEKSSDADFSPYFRFAYPASYSLDDRERTGASLVWHPALADRCRSQRDCHLTRHDWLRE
jgi:hypothetical protein